MLLVCVFGARSKEAEDPATFPPVLEVVLYQRPYNHAEDVYFPQGPKFLQLISIKEPRESYLAFIYDEDGTDFFKMFVPYSSLQQYSEKHYVVISPTEFDSQFKKRQRFTYMSYTFYLALNPMDLIDFFRRVLYGVPFAQYYENVQLVKARIENECTGRLYGEHSGEDDLKPLLDLAMLWLDGNMRQLGVE